MHNNRVTAPMTPTAGEAASSGPQNAKLVLISLILVAAVATAITGSPNAAEVNASVETQLQKSYSSAVETAEQYPEYSTEIIAGAREAFLHGDQWAYLAGIVAVLIGGAIVFFMFPKKDEEEALLTQYHAEDMKALAAVQEATTAPAPGLAPA